MDKNMTYLGFIKLFIPAVILGLGWGMAVSSKQAAQTEDIQNNEENLRRVENTVEKLEDRVDENFKLTLEKLDKIIYSMPKKDDQ